jgi:outer membrane biosynthesis protein TonB
LQQEYPEVAAKARVNVQVGVQVVGRDGRVESATIVKPLPFGRRAVWK